MSQKEQLIEINPYDIKQMKIIETLEDQLITQEIVSKLKNKVELMSEENYKKARRKSNNVDTVFLLGENGIVKGLFSITGEKDIRSCLITVYYVNKCQLKKIISVGAEYALNSMNMQEVFINVKSKDTSTRKYLEEMGYEYLGEESGIITYLKDQGAKEEENVIAYS